MSVWIESVTTSQFEVCLQESRMFDGPHQNIMVVSFSIIIYFPVRTNHVLSVQRYQKKVTITSPSSVIAVVEVS